MMMLSTHPSTGGQSSVVPNCVSNVGFADLDLEVQNALLAFVFKGDLFDPVAVPGDAVSFAELEPEARTRLSGFVFKDDAFEKLSRNVQIDLWRFVFNDESPCDWSEDGVGVLHWVLLKDLVSLHDPETPLADKFELLRWVFTDSELNDNPFSFANWVKVVGCSPHSPTAFFGAIDVDDARRHFSKADDGGGEHVERNVGPVSLLVTYQEFAEAVKPRMSNLHDPSARLMPFDAPPLFLEARSHMRGVAPFADGALRGFTEEARVGAKMLGVLGTGACDDQAIEDGAKLRDVMTISADHDERERDATRVDQQHSLAPIFFPDPSDWVRPTLAPTGPSPTPRRRFASARQCPPCRRIPPGPPAIASRRHPRVPTQGIACEWRLRSQTAPAAAPSTGTLCVIHRRSPRIPAWHLLASDRPLAGEHIPFQALAVDPGPAAQPVSKILRRLPMRPSSVLPLRSPQNRQRRDGRAEYHIIYG